MPTFFSRCSMIPPARPSNSVVARSDHVTSVSVGPARRRAHDRGFREATMKFRVLVTLTTFGLLGVMAPDGAAAPHHAVLGAPKKAAKAAKAVPGQLTKQVTMAPKALKFGMALKQVAKVYDKQFDAEFLPLYKKAEPGPQMTALDAELRDKKALIRRNVVAFNDTPTGVDYTPLKGEYSYGNKETMSRVSLR